METYVNHDEAIFVKNDDKISYISGATKFVEYSFDKLIKAKKDVLTLADDIIEDLVKNGATQISLLNLSDITSNNFGFNLVNFK